MRKFIYFAVSKIGMIISFLLFMIALIAIASLESETGSIHYTGVGLAFFFILYIVVILVCYHHINKNALDELNSVAHYVKATGTLSITGKSKYFEEAIKLHKDMDLSIKYEPEKLHIGAVTVGGVTTGGTYTTGGYNYISGAKLNGLCYLLYKDLDKPIKKIQLTDSLYQTAKESIISQYLDEEKKEIVVIEDLKLSESEKMELLAEIKTQGFSSKHTLLGYPTLEKGIAIKNWISSIE